MSYTITVANSDTLNIATGETDTSTNLVLVGKNVPNYGQIINQNLITLLQNSAGASVPNGPVTGQLWYDTSIKGVKFYTGDKFKLLSAITSSTTAPLTGMLGDFWWDTANSQLKIWDSTNWFAIGPYVLNANSLLVASSVIDTNNFAHSVLKMTVDSQDVAVISRSEFIPKLTFPGFPKINAGINLANNLNTHFTGNVDSAAVKANTITAGNVNAAQIGNASSIIVGTLSTSAQPSITSVGQLTQLSVNGNVSAANFNANGDISASNINSNIATINSLTVTNGILNLSTVTVTANAIVNDIVAGRVSAGLIGNAGALLSGTLTTAIQPNITAVGTLSNLTVDNSITAASATVTTINSANIIAINLTGVVTTNAQPNINSIGTLTDLKATRNISIGNIGQIYPDVNLHVCGNTAQTSNVAIPPGGWPNGIPSQSYTNYMYANGTPRLLLENTGVKSTISTMYRDGSFAGANIDASFANGTSANVVISTGGVSRVIASGTSTTITNNLIANGSPVLDGSNFNSFAPGLSGQNAVGQWNINVATANAAATGTALAKTTTKAWVCFNGIPQSGNASIYSAYNISSVVNISAVQKRINLVVPMSDTNYAVIGAAEDLSSNFLRTTSSFQIVLNQNNSQFVSLSVFGN